MAKPRVFISSTFYDLRQIREDLERFIREIGYEPVRNETGAIPYGKEASPERSAYREVGVSDIIISIIGSRFGSESANGGPYSISMEELKRALEEDIQVFIFIDKGVWAEYSTYRLNKDNDEIKYGAVDDKRIYEFIDEINKLPQNNAIATFETSVDITSNLQAQWAGLFQRFLSEQKRQSEFRIVQEMNSVARTLRDLVKFLTQERDNKDAAIQEILLANHPAFARFAALTNTPYRVYFTNLKELNIWLRNRQWKPIPPDGHDDDSYYEWNKEGEGYIALKHDIFNEDGKLKVYTADEWDDDWLTKTAVAPVPSQDDDIPF